MAKMFYTLEETKSALNRSEEDIKQFAREGRLREFRDGPRLMYKADQVENLKSDIGADKASEAPPANWEPHPDVLVSPVVAEQKITDDSSAPDDVKVIDNLMRSREFMLSLEAVAAVLRKMSGFEDSNPLFGDLADRIMSNVRGIQYNRQKLRDELDQIAAQAEAAANNTRSLKQRLY
jgi:hypothetical protein